MKTVNRKIRDKQSQTFNCSSALGCSKMLQPVSLTTFSPLNVLITWDYYSSKVEVKGRSQTSEDRDQHKHYLQEAFSASLIILQAPHHIVKCKWKLIGGAKWNSAALHSSWSLRISTLKPRSSIHASLQQRQFLIFHQIQNRPASDTRAAAAAAAGGYEGQERLQHSALGNQGVESTLGCDPLLLLH